MTIDIVLDVDTGVDDALALLFAATHPGLRLRAVSCVAGNVAVDQVVRNTFTVLETAGRGDVPVGRGADRPLVNPPADARFIHGRDGMGDLGLATSRSRPVDIHAVELLRRTISDHPGLTLVALAPLTNIALLLRMHPEVREQLGEIMLMGGSAGGGNASAAAEFNIWHDPEAAAIVMDSGLPVTMYGLDVFYQVAPRADEVAALRAAQHPAARLAAALLGCRKPADRRIPSDAAGWCGDAGAVCAVAEPDALVTRAAPVEVALASGPARGQTIVDFREEPGEAEIHDAATPAPRATVAVGVDGRRYSRLFVQTLCDAPDR